MASIKEHLLAVADETLQSFGRAGLFREEASLRERFKVRAEFHRRLGTLGRLIRGSLVLSEGSKRDRAKHRDDE